MSFFKKILNNRGLSITEMVVGSAFVLTGMGVIFNHVYSIQSIVNKSEVVTSAADIEVQLISQLQDSQYLASKAEDLRTGAVPDFEIFNTKGTLIARYTGHPNFNPPAIGVYANGSPCSEIGRTDCDIYTTLAINCENAGSYWQCGAAYNISTPISNKNKIARKDLGVEKPFDTNPTEKFTLPLSYDVFSNTIKTCSTGTLPVTGIDTRAGELFCADLPTNSCAANELPIGFTYTPTGSGGGEFSLDCMAPRDIGCPSGIPGIDPTPTANFTLNSVDPQALDGRSSALKGTCVHNAKEFENWTVPAQETTGTVSGTFCPPNYNVVDLTCTVVTPATDITFANGVCDDLSVVVADTSNPGGYQINVSANKNTDTCSVTYTPQACSAWVRAKVTMNGRCRSTFPQTLDAI